MSARRLSSLVALGLAVTIALLTVLAVRPTAARPQADFAPPLSETLAQASVAAHSAAAVADRAVAAQEMGAANIGSLPNLRTVYFAETGHHLSNRTGFLDFWRANGQVLIFGYPVTEEIVERGRIVQYFERGRLEYNPELGQVQLGLVGAELLQIQGLPPRVDDPQSGAAYFPETGHSLWGEFKGYWEKRGGLAAFGYPLSEVVDEGGRQVQYFERAKMEHHPEDMAAFFRSMESYNGFNLNSLFEVRLSDIGRQLAGLRGVNMAMVPQLPGAATWNPAIFARHIEVDLSRQWLTAYEGELPVYSAPVATGRDGFNTPTGDYAIYYRLPMQTMVGDMGGESWNVPNVPWVQYVVGGVALHGTYWHDAHGTGARMSHGCINLKIDDAQWLYEWADIGTTVSIHY